MLQLSIIFQSNWVPVIVLASQLMAGASLSSAIKINNRQFQTAINWTGGLHHAKKCSCSGFCFINDIVIAIVELLKRHKRVLYIDIDVHHGDGVEEAFYHTNRVMTVSFHQYGYGFFPGTGNYTNIGCGEEGTGYALNIPLKQGIKGEKYLILFKTVMTQVIDKYRPDAIVMQCGADSLANDQLGLLNLKVQDHADCLEFIRQYRLPMLVLGGGGYTITNVSKCWTYQTSVLLEKEINHKIQGSDFQSIYGKNSSIFIYENQSIIDENEDQDIQRIVEFAFQQLSKINSAPSVQYRVPQFSYEDYYNQKVEQSYQ